MKNIPKISVCIIAKNEENMLTDCLKSIQSIAYEIIVVDTGSTDRTKEIALSFGCKTYDFAWINDFSAARNESLKYVTGDYVLFIDADERVVNPDAVVQTITSALPNTGAWVSNIVSHSLNGNKITDRNVTAVLRLFKYEPEFKFEGIIHEQILPSILKKGYKIETSAIEIQHLGYALSENEMEKKHLRNLDLLEKWLEKYPDDNYNMAHKGKTLVSLNRLQEAAEVFDKLIERMSDNTPAKIQVLNYGAINAYRLGNYEKALNLASLSKKRLPNQSFANFILGELHSTKNNHSEALQAYIAMRDAIEKPDLIATVSGEFQLPMEQVYWRIGRSLLAINDCAGAVEAFEKGLTYSPADAMCLFGFANVAFKLKKYSEAKAIAESILQANPNNQLFINFLKQLNEIIQEKPATSTATPSSITQINSENQKLISVCMIVKNEEKMLEGCLESVKNIADEIIIVDTGSTDSTVEIAIKYNARIFYFAWIDDFSAARNESIKYATAKWILYLDADERLTEIGQNQIRNLVSTANSDIGGYFCTIESDHSKLDGSAEKHRGGYPRLFRNLGFPNIKFMGRVHEQISPSIIAAKKIILASDIIIEHLGYNLPHEDMEKKVKRNYNMLLAHINEEPTNGYAWFQLGQTLGQMGMATEAENATRFAIECGNLSDSVYASAAATLAQFTGRKKNFAEALHWSNESLSKAPNQLYGLSLKAHALLYLGRKKEAEPVFIEALNFSKSNPSMPKTGFDIEVSEDILLKGLAESRK